MLNTLEKSLIPILVGKDIDDLKNKSYLLLQIRTKLLK